ncbi:hypothetical protein SM033_00014 [Vibrio phage vB_VpaM_sm033]|nr:hypothetical protein SM033_00014 [Vibrio phage vB_VpaM_sm033]
MFENIAIGWYLILAVFAVAVIVASNKRHKNDPGNPAYGLDEEVDIPSPDDSRKDLLQMSVMGEQFDRERRDVDQITDFMKDQDGKMFRFTLSMQGKSHDFVWSANVVGENLENLVINGYYSLETWVELVESDRMHIWLFNFDHVPTIYDTHDSSGISFVPGDVANVKDVNKDKQYYFYGRTENGLADWREKGPASTGRIFRSMYFKRKYANANT